MEETIVLVVGTGAAGLGIAACLTKKSIPYIVLEKEDCYASLWKKRAYDRCHLHLAKEFCSLPYKPHAPHAKKYMSKNDFIEYIDNYVSDFDIRPRYFHSVESASFNEAKGKWLVEAKDTLVKITKVFVASFLVVATGENGKGYIPKIPGLKDFKGDIIHSTEYKSGREFQDKDVLVVECGNSGMEISYDLCNSGANTSIVIRNPVHVVTREMISVGMHLLKYLSLSTVDALVTFASMLMYGNLSKYGIFRPNEGPFLLKATKGRSHVLDVGTIAEIQSGKTKVLPEIERIKKSRVIFEDKVELDFDAIIFATGYKSTACEWLKDYGYILNSDGFPKNRFPTHWKGNNNLYCAGLSRMGLQGVSKDAIAIANDIEIVLKTMLRS
ncbi:probable indole-3-pyruvate monooxygenase YUCCA10 [Chenopodium quinoa]|uniref:probable indole-3-pyruvate monooxygenase YUCCA10 n=1 Tax=Chenopodium quinoa TaxID=63459 RepID=UPI000B788B91|nr:probable indole-3-pyruvate monooxygenase YUCCA10 [Chenopodium quinoa]